jgi:ribonuclease BN (tRNA processing enzyme)
LHDFLNSLLSSEAGAYAYLSDYLNGNGRLPLLEQIEVEPGLNGAIRILSDADSDEHVDALYVPHGIVPALAYRIQVGAKSIVFSSDQNGSSKQFVDFARNATVLVMHMPVPEGVTGAGRKLHAPPSVIGEIAAQAEVDQLVLSHFMARSLRDLDGNVSLIRSEFDGSVMTANDLDCFAVGH